MKNLRISNIKFQISNFKSKFIGNCKLEIRNCKFQRAFTLIELLIAITIIAILIGAGTYTWMNGQMKGRDGRRKEDLKQVQSALELYAHENGQYPNANSNNIQCNTSDGDTTVIFWGNEFKCGTPMSTTYMQKLPSDPIGPINYKYYPVADTRGKIANYVIWSTLENTSTTNPDYCIGISCFAKLIQQLPICMNDTPNYCGYQGMDPKYHYFVINP